MKELVIEITATITEKEAKQVKEHGINCVDLGGRITVGIKPRIAKVKRAYIR